jgi:hypothetical protein
VRTQNTFTLIVAFASLIGLTLSGTVLADPVTDHTPNVSSIVENNDVYQVTCIDNSQGTLSVEDKKLCAFSDQNHKNFCNDTKLWTVNDAASYVCSEISSPSQQ